MSDRWTEARHAAVRERCEAATAGPWYAGTDCGALILYSAACTDSDEPEPALYAEICGAARSHRASNARFIAAARQDLPAALAEIERLRAEVDAERSQADREVERTVRALEAIERAGNVATERAATVERERDALRRVVRMLPTPADGVDWLLCGPGLRTLCYVGAATPGGGASLPYALRAAGLPAEADAVEACR